MVNGKLCAHMAGCLIYYRNKCKLLPLCTYLLNRVSKAMFYNTE